MTSATDRRTALADAAIEVIATGGIRQLTHRAVDTAAGFPTGTTSYHHRTRRALLRAVLNRIAEISAQRLTVAPGRQVPPAPTTRIERLALAAQLAALTAQFVDAQAGAYRLTTLARFACEIEVASDPELREILHAGDPFRDLAAGWVSRLGVAEPMLFGRDLVAFAEGLTYDRLIGTGSLSNATPGTPESVAELTRSLQAYLEGLVPPN